MNRGRTAFTLVEILIACVATSIIIGAACEFYLLTIKQWDVQTSYGGAVQTTDTALERIEASVRFATGFSSKAAGANTLYVFTLPANNTSGSTTTANFDRMNGIGQYIPQRVSGTLQYVPGLQVAFYLSDTTGLTTVTGGTILWRATAPAGGSNFTPDSPWSMVNTTVGRCTGFQSFSISSVPPNAVSVALSVQGTSRKVTKTYTSQRKLYMGCAATLSSTLAAPANLTATAGSGQITLNWTASSGATTYSVYRGSTSGGESATALATGIAGTTYTDSSVSNGSTYYYYVVAVASTTSGESNEASATVGASGNVTVSTSVPSMSNYYGDEKITITNSQPMTSLTVTVVVKKDAGMTNNGSWNNFWGGYLPPPQNPTDNGTTFTYIATETTGDAQTSGTYAIDNSFNLNNTVHLSSGDTYTVQVTAGGVSQTLTGHF